MRDELDAAIAVALHAAAGELQREMAEVGASHVAEADLRRAVRRGLQTQLGHIVQPELTVPNVGSWHGRLGGFDVGVSQDGILLGGIELKWCRRPDNLAEAVWDALKLLPFSTDYPEAFETYLIYAAPSKLWEEPGDRPAPLFSSAQHRVADLLSTYEKYWAWLLSGNKSARPRELSSEFTTSLVAAVPILSATEPPWELRGIRIQAVDSGVICFDQDGLIADESIGI